MFVGGEVNDTNGNTIQIVSIPAYRADPVNWTSWNFEPVAGYAAQGQIARSDDPSTWPPFWPEKLDDPTDPGWPGSWNGLLGKNVMIDGVEFYYHFSDNLYSRHPFFPDSTDLTRRGLGIVVSQRVLEWNDPLIADAVVVVSDITNVGTSDIENAAVTIWVPDMVGGDGDSQDDLATYDLGNDIIYFNDLDGISSNPAFLGVHVGAPVLAFLQSPDNLGITNIQYNPAGAINFQETPDSMFWNSFMEPGSFFDPNTIPPGEFDLFASSGFFSLPVCVSKRLVTAYTFADDSASARRTAKYLDSFASAGFSFSDMTLSLLSPISGQVFVNEVNIDWDAEAGDPLLLVDLLYSSNYGRDWFLLRENEPNDGSYQWRVDSLDDGVLYKVLILAHDSSRVAYRTMEGSFVINTSEEAPPQILLVNPQAEEWYEEELPITWVGGDADGEQASVSLSYRTQGNDQWTPISTDLPDSGIYLWNTREYPNSSLYWLKGSITDGQFSAMDSVGLFWISNPRYGIPDSSYVLRNTTGTGRIEPHIVDSTAINGHRYRVTFTVSPTGTTTYDVTDETTGLTVVEDATQVNGGIEGPLFDGMRLFIQNDTFALIDSLSGWTRAGIHDLSFSIWRLGFEEGIPDYGDYVVEIGTVGIDTSTIFRVGGMIFPAIPVNCRVTNTVTGLNMPFGFLSGDGGDGEFTASIDGLFARSDGIVILTETGEDSLAPSWRISMEPTTGSENPASGDSLRLLLTKPFRSADYLLFDADLGPMLSVHTNRPVSSELTQNYPNPFNATTEIRFTISRRTSVTLNVFDILGRHVRSLLNETMDGGGYTLRWDGTGDSGTQMATGVYFLRLVAEGRAETRKMLLLR
jgi:hypothetical protein